MKKKINHLSMSFIKRSFWMVGISFLLAVVEGYKGTTGIIGQAFIGMMLVVLGMMMTSYDYPGLIGVQAKRKTYLKEVVLTGVIGSSVLMILLELVYQGVAMAFWEGNMQVALQSVLKSLIRLIVIGFFVMALGILIGSLFYRFQLHIALCIIGIVPIMVTMSIVAQLLLENEISSLLMIGMLMLVNPAFHTAGQLVYGVLAYGISLLLLSRAPGRAYAHDIL